MKQFSFTVLLIAAVLIASICSKDFSGKLMPDWISGFGLAPRHIAMGELFRLISSVLLTHDLPHLFIAITMILLAVGWLEWRSGATVAAVVFLGTHLVSVLIFAIGVGGLHVIDFHRSVSAIYAIHDVGPSAGYYGCLAACLASVQFRYRSIVVGLLVFMLVARIAFSISYSPDSKLALSADLVHLIAICVGVMMMKVVFYGKALSNQHNLK